MGGWIESPLRFRAALLACGVGLGSYVVGALALPPGADLARHVGWFLVSFAFYLVAVAVLLAAGGAGQERSRRGDLALILIVALLLRGGLLATTPSLSDDVFRYVWDGKVQGAGIDPYRYPPSAPELAHLRGPLWEGINHKEMPTPYPPAAQGLFRAVHAVAPDSLVAMQSLAVAFDLGVVVLLILMLARAGLDRRRVLIYAWNPMVAVQYAHSGHYDAAMVLPLLGALYALAVGSRAASGALLGLAALVKLVPAMAAPLFVSVWGWAGLAAAALVVVGGTLRWLASGQALAGLASEAADARFNDSAGYLLVKLWGAVLPNPEVGARGVSGLILVGASLGLARFLWRRRADWEGVLLGTYWLLGLFLLLNAVVEPWYLAWIVPFLCFTLAPGGWGMPKLDPALGWLLLSGTVVLTDLTYLPAGSSLWLPVRAAEYGPLYALLGSWLWRRLRRRG